MTRLFLANDKEDEFDIYRIFTNYEYYRSPSEIRRIFSNYEYDRSESEIRRMFSR